MISLRITPLLLPVIIFFVFLVLYNINEKKNESFTPKSLFINSTTIIHDETYDLRLTLLYKTDNNETYHTDFIVYSNENELSVIQEATNYPPKSLYGIIFCKLPPNHDFFCKLKLIDTQTYYILAIVFACIGFVCGFVIVFLKFCGKSSIVISNPT